MVYFVHTSGSKFWRCELDGATVHITYGKCGGAGRTMKKDFASEAAAATYLARQESSKRKGGYADAVDPAAPAALPQTTGTAPRKRTRAATDASPAPAAAARGKGPATPTRTAGLGGFAAPAVDACEETAVDAGVAGLDGALASRARVHGECHARLALVDPAVNADKYYILQMLIDERPQKRRKGKANKTRGAGGGGGSAEYHLFTRWGRTGTGGQAKMVGPFADEDDARAAFEKAFEAKTAVAWRDAVAGEAPKAGKYEYLAAAPAVDGDVLWHYYLRDDPLGKRDGWYAYDRENSAEVEELYGDYKASRHAPRLARRCVTSASSSFTYQVDLAAMQQTNTASGRTRPIGRTEDGSPPRQIPVTATKIATVLQTNVAPPTTPQRGGVAGPKRGVAVSPGGTASGAVDRRASARLQAGTVHEDCNVMLNQTNLGANNNKFYKIQLVRLGGAFFLYTRWGRVGEDGATQEQGPFRDEEAATREFAKKFKAKTANKWEDYREERDSFVSKKGKYTVLEMEQDENAAATMAAAAAAAPNGKPFAKSELCVDTKDLVDLIFDQDMFKAAMTNMKLDPKKLPLGALSESQIAKGFSVLERLEDVIKRQPRNKKKLLEDVTSEFYTLVPHAFGRSAGPVLDSAEKVQEKYEMLNTLSDIEAAQSMQRVKDEGGEDEDVQPNPSDLHYNQLDAKLTQLNPTEDEDYKLISAYYDDTKDARGYGGQMKLRHVWRVDRRGEEERFAEHTEIEQRKLLWHGTNVAVVAAILKSGLRIMPHSGGRVGRGIYLADQHKKSACYTRSAQGTTIMFLVEAALGESHEILRDNPSLTEAPAGYDSVLAKGRMAPPKDDQLEIDDNSVAVPNGKPKAVKGAAKSSFEHNEFLIYKESQHRIRFILTFGN